MDNENPFAQQTFQPAPMFTDDQKVTDQPAAPSPQRKSRRVSRTATSSPPSPGVPTSPRPKRKYTRRKAARPLDAAIDKAAQVGGRKSPAGVTIEMLALFQTLSTPEFEAVKLLAQMGRDSCVRVYAALQAVLPK